MTRAVENLVRQMDQGWDEIADLWSEIRDGLFSEFDPEDLDRIAGEWPEGTLGERDHVLSGCDHVLAAPLTGRGSREPIVDYSYMNT